MEFKKIESYELYEVSDTGLIRSIKKDIILAEDDCHGYKRVEIAGKHKRIHHLVMEAFGPEKPGDEYEIDHIDNNKANNSISNLQWLSHRDNTIKSCGKKIKCVETGETFPALTVAAEKAGVSIDSFRWAIKQDKPVRGFHYIKLD